MGKNAKRRREVRGHQAVKGLHYEGTLSTEEVLAGGHEEDILVLTELFGHKWEKRVGDLTQDDIDMIRALSIENHLEELDDDDIKWLMNYNEKINKEKEKSSHDIVKNESVHRTK